MEDGRPNDEKGDCARRRELRAKQRKALQGIKGHTDAYDTARETNNKLFRRVRHTRELKLDAEIMEARAESSVEYFHNLYKPSRFDPFLIVQELKGKYSSVNGQGKKVFDWKALGLGASGCANTLPQKITFLSVPLMNADAGLKLRQKRRVVLPPLEVATATEMVAEEMEEITRANKLTAAELHMKTLKKLLRSNCAKAALSRKDGADAEDPGAIGNEIDMVPFLFNPKSFTQTIENILHFSHLVKKGLAGIRRSDSGAVYIRCTEPDEEKEGSGAGNRGYATTQAVLSITMSDWRALIEAYGLEKGALPDRNYEQAAAFSVEAKADPEARGGSGRDAARKVAAMAPGGHEVERQVGVKGELELRITSGLGTADCGLDSTQPAIGEKRKQRE